MLSPSIFTIAASTFGIFFVIHILAWRLLSPRSHISAILINFIFVPTILLAIYLGVNNYSISDGIFTIFLYLAVASAYVQTYPAFQAISPSLKIVYHIGKSKQGLSTAEIEQQFDKSELISDRFNNLIEEKLVVVNENKFLVLSPSAKILSGFFYYYRRILGLEEGMG